MDSENNDFLYNKLKKKIPKGKRAELKSSLNCLAEHKLQALKEFRGEKKGFFSNLNGALGWLSSLIGFVCLIVNLLVFAWLVPLFNTYMQISGNIADDILKYSSYIVEISDLLDRDYTALSDYRSGYDALQSKYYASVEEYEAAVAEYEATVAALERLEEISNDPGLIDPETEEELTDPEVLEEKIKELSESLEKAGSAVEEKAKTYPQNYLACQDSYNTIVALVKGNLSSEITAYTQLIDFYIKDFLNDPYSLSENYMNADKNAKQKIQIKLNFGDKAELVNEYLAAFDAEKLGADFSDFDMESCTAEYIESVIPDVLDSYVASLNAIEKNLSKLYEDSCKVASGYSKGMEILKMLVTVFDSIIVCILFFYWLGFVFGKREQEQEENYNKIADILNG